MGTFYTHVQKYEGHLCHTVHTVHVHAVELHVLIVDMPCSMSLCVSWKERSDSSTKEPVFLPKAFDAKWGGG